MEKYPAERLRLLPPTNDKCSRASQCTRMMAFINFDEYPSIFIHRAWSRGKKSGLEIILIFINIHSYTISVIRKCENKHYKRHQIHHRLCILNGSGRIHDGMANTCMEISTFMTFVSRLHLRLPTSNSIPPPNHHVALKAR